MCKTVQLVFVPIDNINLNSYFKFGNINLIYFGNYSP